MSRLSALSPPSSTPVGSSTVLVYLDKCAVCGDPASKLCGGCSNRFYCSPHHQRLDWPSHKEDCRLYHVKDVVQDGRSSVALVASKHIPENTVVISEYPLLTFEHSAGDNEGLSGILKVAEVSPIKCFACDGWIREEGRHLCTKCGLPLCSIKCEQVGGHSADCQMLREMRIRETRNGPDKQAIGEDMRVLRVIFKEFQKGNDLMGLGKKDGPLKAWAAVLHQMGPQIIDKDEGAEIRKNFPLSLAATPGKGKTMQDLKLVKGLLKTMNAYSIPFDRRNQSKHALFEKYSLLSHSCAPNHEWWLDTSGYSLKLLVRSIAPILPGTTLTIFRPADSTILLNPTLLRRPKLARLLHSPCSCPRCASPTELSTFLSGLRCALCKQVSAPTFSYMYPESPLERHPSWKCTSQSCSASKSYEQILVITLKAEKALDVIWQDPQIPTNSSLHTCEAVISKLQSFISSHARKILHPFHYLIMTAKSRINRVVSHFLGSGAKLFLCVATTQPRAYDYCTYKIDHILGFLNLITKLYGGPTRTTGKLKCELVYAETAVLLRDFHEKRVNGVTFFKRLHKIMEYITDCITFLKIYSHYKSLVEDVTGFRTMLRALLGKDVTAGYRKKVMQNSSLEENTLRMKIAVAIDRWTKLCEQVDLRDFYIHPQKRDGPPHRVGSNTGTTIQDNVLTKDDLKIILMDVTSEVS